MLQRCLPLCVGKKNCLSRHITTLRARFRLLHLGLSMLQGDFLTNSVVKNVLRERIYLNAMDYFRYLCPGFNSFTHKNECPQIKILLCLILIA